MEERPGTLNELHGMLGFIDSIDFYNKSITSDAPSKEKVIERKCLTESSLMYSTFYAGTAPCSHLAVGGDRTTSISRIAI